MPQTELQAFPYPALSDPANGPVAFQQLAEAAERQVIIRCTSTTRPTPAEEGMVIYETDTDALYVFDGASWNLVWQKQSRPHGHINKTGPQTTTSGSGYVNVTFNNAAHAQPASFADLAGNRLVIPRTGIYIITAYVAWSTGGGTGRRDARVLRNGNAMKIHRSYNNDGFGHWNWLNLVRTLTAGDALSVEAQQVTGSNIDITGTTALDNQNETFLSAHWLGH